MERHKVLIAGAGPSGLAVGATLRREGIQAILVDESARVGDVWRGHYDRLHLHTVRWLSGLPGLPIPRSEGKWVPRDGVARYLETYARHHGLLVRHGTSVKRIERADGEWAVRTSAGDLLAEHVVVATGLNRIPALPAWDGRDTFTGDLVHSREYRNPRPYRGKRVLVIGTGNSGAEIAIDLIEGGAAEVLVAVRTPPNIQRRDLLGVPTHVIGLGVRRLPRRVGDAITLRMQRIAFGDLTRYGLQAPPRGAVTRVLDEIAVPILDVGFVDLVKKGRVRVVAAVERFEDGDVVLADGERVRPEAVIAATGFRRGLEPLVGHLGLLRDDGRAAVHGPVTDPRAPELYFIGYSNPLGGNLHEIAVDSRKIARAIARRRRQREPAGVAQPAGGGSSPPSNSSR